MLASPILIPSLTIQLALISLATYMAIDNGIKSRKVSHMKFKDFMVKAGE